MSAFRKDKRDYPALFEEIFRLRRPEKVWSNDHVILTSFGESESDRMPYIGAIGKFTNIPDDAEWLDTESLDAADEDQLREIVIPASLKPNYESFYCGLFPKQHIFMFETFSESERLPVGHVLKWLRNITKDTYILEKFGPVDVDILPDYQVVDKILSSDNLREIKIQIGRPNPDDYTAEQFHAAEERLRRLNAKEEIIEYKADLGQYLELDDHTEALARVGAENGRVDARLREDGVIRKVSTDEHPLEEQEMFDPDVTPPLMMFRSLGQRFLASVSRNRDG